MEYMAGGDLLHFLRNVKGANQLMHKGDSVPFLADYEKLDISRQISLGLEFLSSKQVSFKSVVEIFCLTAVHHVHLIPGPKITENKRNKQWRAPAQIKVFSCGCFKNDLETLHIMHTMAMLPCLRTKVMQII